MITLVHGSAMGFKKAASLYKQLSPSLFLHQRVYPLFIEEIVQTGVVREGDMLVPFSLFHQSSLMFRYVCCFYFCGLP